MEKILRRITKIHGVRGAVLVGADGFVIASDLAEGLDGQSLGAVAASVADSVRNAAARLDQGALTRFVMNGSKASVVLHVVDDAILLTMVRKGANMGMVLVELKGCLDELRSALGA